MENRPPQKSGPVPEPSSAARILIIDDEPLLLEALVRILERSYQVVGVGSGEDALKKFRENPQFDAVICDLHLNDRSGMEIFEEVVEHPALRERFIFLTGGAVTQVIVISWHRRLNP